MNESSQKTILLVEDEAIIAMAETRLLKKHGYEVVTAGSAAKAIKTADSNPNISLILMDIDLGSGMDGTQAAREILTRHDIPIVFLTSHTEKEYVDRVRSITGYGYVLKDSGEFILVESIHMAYTLFDAKRELKTENSVRRESEDFLKQITSNSPVAIYVYDLNEGRVVFGNQAYEKFLGYTLGEIQEMGPELLERVYHPDFKEQLRRHDEKLFADRKGDVFETEYKVVGGEGRIGWGYARELVLTRNPDGSAARILGIALDTTEQKRQGEELKRSEERFRTLFNLTPDAVLLADADTGKIIQANNAAEDLFQIPLDNLIGMNHAPLYSEELFEKADAEFKKGSELLSKPFPPLEMIIATPSGVDKTVELRASALHLENRLHLLGTFRDITERKQAEKALARTSILLKESQELANLGSWNWDMAADKWEFSEQWKRIHGVSDDDLGTSKLLEIAHPEDARYIEKAFSEAKEDGKPYNIQHRIIRADNNETRYIHSLGVVEYSPDTGCPLRMVGTAQDITAQKHAEEKIQRQLTEKETLLEEVHHRIKNNMASIEGLLSIQAESADSAEVKSALKEAISRVRSTRTLYEKLLIGKRYEDVSMKDYLESLIDSLVEVFNDRPSVTVEKRLADFPLNAKRAIPVGIMLNELLTNVFKYAFTGRDSGHVSIELDKTETQASLAVTDDGVGLDKKVEGNKPSGFGLTLVNMLAEQLNGTFSIIGDNGTKSVVEFGV